MRVAELFIKKGTKFRTRGLHDLKTVNPDELRQAVDRLLAADKDYTSILRYVDYEFGADAKSYVRRYLSGTISEEVWAIPDTGKKVLALRKLLGKRLPAKNAAQALNHLLGNSELRDMLDSLASENPMQDSREAIFGYLSTAYPELCTQLRGGDDMKRNGNIEGTLSPLGHFEEDGQ